MKIAFILQIGTHFVDLKLSLKCICNAPQVLVKIVNAIFL